MKPGKLYLKIFLSFLALLIVTEVFIFGFFVVFIGRKYHDYYEEYNQTRFNMAREMIEFNIRESAGDRKADDDRFQEFLNHLGLAFKSMIWIKVDGDGIPYKSFTGPLPQELISKHRQEPGNTDDRSSLFKRRGDVQIYYVDRIKLHSDQPDTELHILFDDRPKFEHRAEFAGGLFAIGIIIALLTFPLSRNITKPIKVLTRSARKLGKGELSNRAEIKSKDEIGELGTAFNTMADKLEDMIRSGRELTAQVSHELRSPLTRIQIAVELVKDRLISSDDRELQNSLSEIQSDIRGLDRLIGRILELSKLDLQDSDNHIEPILPMKIMDQVLAGFASAITDRELDLNVEYASHRKISGRSEHMTTLFENLIDNVIKFTPGKGKAHIRIYDEKDHVCLSIINDVAEPIGENDLSKLFQPFFRMNPQETNGSGLGLTIAEKIVEKHRGKIKALHKGAGLEIRILLPARTGSGSIVSVF